jgi:hypothetical protein
VEGVPPGNCQLKVVLLAEEVLVYCTVSGLHPTVLEAVKAAVGGVAITTVPVVVVVPQVLEAFRVTVYVPSAA